MALSQNRFPVVVDTPLGADKLVVSNVHGEERISGLFHYSLEMLSDDSALAFDSIVGQGVTVSVSLSNGDKRYFHGLCTRFSQAGTTARGTVYHAELRPWLWMLTLTSDCRIYQNKSVPDIAKAIFGELGYTDFKDSLTGTYDAREYCVQYRETAFDFISRLFEEEGIFYFFEHADGKHTLVLADATSAHAAGPGQARARYGTTGTEQEQDDTVTRVALEGTVIPRKVTLDDYEFTTPSTDLNVSQEGSLFTTEMRDYPGNHAATAKGETRAKVRLEAWEAAQKTLRGEGSHRGFTAGFKFTLAGHVRDDVNGDYVLRSVSFSAGQDHYSNSFEALPAATLFRAPRATPRPVIPGTQTAQVVGKSGEEIWTDQYGRIKVQFHWDRLGTNDENSSCWIRVASGWAGKGWGAIHIPRIGQEVVVSFLEGDPDRPLVTGSVYNAEQTVPYPLPDEQTRSTLKSNSSKGGGAFNEMRFEDKKDSEEIYVRAAKDMNISVKNDRTATIDEGNETLTVTKGKRETTVSEGDNLLTVTKGKRETTVSEGDNLLTVTKGKRTVTVGEGDETLTVSKGKRTVTVDAGDEAHKVGGKRTVEVTGAETHKNTDKFDHSTGGNYTLKVTGDLVIEATGNVTIKAGMGMTVKGGTTMALESGTSFSAKGLSVAVEASAALSAKGSASTTVESSGITQVKGSLVKIN
ncbi:type VI secretion system Vgr family protein [Longimicrobium sp.]|uniref:type VI secretion system Vgr family protein n=1 Tax=Longimicrobium sp. TaxID=2029185 RepID=UPI002C911C82|nr:type VI secretion system tip protein TssI/VgrG [Longimicrobium sp.]HSU13830.1 type VI secretion system tip protein TssI/VgrG [Longimicrobium sp.]